MSMNTRLERVGQLIRDEIADILHREIQDPLIGFVTLTEVEVSPDLRHAKVFFSVLGSPEQVQDSIKGLLRARKHINALLADRLDLRYIPKLRFVYDDTAAKAQRMAELLRHEHEVLGPDLERHEAEAAVALSAPEQREGFPAAEDASSRPATAAEDDSLNEDEDFDSEFEDEAVEAEDFGEDEEDKSS
jgi:ribosome-binding factor A